MDGWTNAKLQWMVEGLGIEQVNWWGNGGGGNISAAVGHSILAIAALMLIVPRILQARKK